MTTPPPDDDPTAQSAGQESGTADADPPQVAGGDRRRRWIGRGLIVLGVLVLLSAGWVGWRTYQAYRHLNAAASQVSLLQQQVRSLDDIDLTKANAAVGGLHSEAADAVSATSDPLYRVAAHLPWIGPNLRAVSEIAATVDSLASTTAPSLIEVARTVQPSALAPRNGAINVAPITAAAATLQSADAEVTAAEQRIAAMSRRSLVGPVARALDTLQSKLATLSNTTGSAARIGRLAPPMLGAEGERKYLVVFQNLAEPRATGGIFGSYALLLVDHGRLTIADQGSGARDLGTFKPSLPMPARLPEALYGQLPAHYAPDVNLTPDFPTAAELFAQMYAIRKSVQVDGVLAIDPVALSYLIEGSKPIAIEHGLTLTSSNITRILLSTVYAIFPQATDVPARDVFLADATAKAFAAVTHSPGDPAATLRGLTRATAEHRILLWSVHPSEEADIARTDLVGRLPAYDGSAPTIGVYRNDGTGGKLGYYAGGSASATPGACLSPGIRSLLVTVHLTYGAPSGGLPAYVNGPARAGPYVLRTNIMVFAPIRGDLSSVSVNGDSVPTVWAVEGGRKVGMVTVDLHPGQDATVQASLGVATRTGGATSVKPVLVLTPGVTDWKTSTTAFAPC